MNCLAFCLFLALVTAPDSSAKGIAPADWQHQADADLLNVGWVYNWGEGCAAWKGEQTCYNQVRAWQLPRQCYQTFFVGEEPNWVEPGGYPMTPTLAAQKFIAIENACPNSRLVAGNVAHPGGAAWLSEFLAEYRTQAGRDFTQALGAHCFGGLECISILAEMRALYSGEFWITGWNCVGCSPAGFGEVLRYVAENFQKHAAYTNREPGQPNYILALVRDDGTLTPNGEVYAEFGR